MATNEAPTFYTIKSHITAPNGAGAKELLYDLANSLRCELKVYDEDKGWFQTQYFYEIKGTKKRLRSFGLRLKQAINDFNNEEGDEFTEADEAPKKKNTKFYCFSQNNSGGDFDVDENVAQYVFIEARNVDEANEKATTVGIYFGGVAAGRDCECCGDRWHPASEYDAGDKPTIYGTPLSVAAATQHRNQAIVYYADGTKKYVKFKGGKQ